MKMKFHMLVSSIPVFSNYALSGLDSKVSAEMRSTGEGIAIAANLNEALQKAFHVTLKEQNGECYSCKFNRWTRRLP